MKKDDNFLSRFNPGSAIIGPDGEEVSMQIVQAVYNELTGRTEELNQFVRSPFRLKFADLRDLDTKVQQLFEQYHIKSKNSTISIFYTKDAKDTFSSFDRFSAFDTSTLRTIENIVIKYEFMIILPEVRRPQKYSLSIQLMSGIATATKTRGQLPPGMPAFAIFHGPTARVSIEYVDYMVARTFLDAVSQWVEGLDSASPPKWLAPFINNSEWVRRATQALLVGTALYICSFVIPRLIPNSSTALPVFAKIQLWAIVLLYFSGFLGKFIGAHTEIYLDQLRSSSIITLTRGDDKLAEANGQERKQTVTRVFISVLFTLIIGIAASIIANILTAPKP